MNFRRIFSLKNINNLAEKNNSVAAMGRVGNIIFVSLVGPVVRRIHLGLTDLDFL